MKNQVETIENRWDIMYRRYPEVYEEFSRVERRPNSGEFARKYFDIDGKIVADIGSGIGRSTFALAKYAKRVIGIEPEKAMRTMAVRYARMMATKNVTFRKGCAEKMPLRSHSVDVVISVYGGDFRTKSKIEAFVRESSRVLAKGGLVVVQGNAPGWYGGELDRVIRDENVTDKLMDRTFRALGFRHKDLYQNQEYGSLRRIVSTYGFIFGKNAIEYLKRYKKTSINWKTRFWYRRFEQAE